ncbi:MAG: MaoC family dehydratase N-terminal domain-containing protein [Dehalococcoidia bacterium]|nr:MaoC family dehydratase N-terminal domain-containing protein [Dehalococcoidia bacterium]
MAEEESTLKMADAVITDESLAEWRKRVGVKLRIGNIFNELACKDNIRKFCNGIGDGNPLFRDEAYAKKSRYGGLIAPPNFLYSVFPTWVLQGLPGIHGFHAGNDWEFYRPVRLGDEIVPESVFTGFEEKKSSFAGRMVMEYQDALYYNNKKELFAKAKTWIVRAERKAARTTGKYHKFQLPHPWTEAELAKVEEQALNEEIRGSKTRYWEDVKIGDKLGPVVIGPFGLTDMIAYCVGSSPIEILAHGLALQLYRKHPAWAFRDPGTGAMEPIYGVHYNKAAANFAGLPFPYDAGVQRNCWFIRPFVNWMGDEGWLKSTHTEYREFFYFSDVLWFQGEVTKKYFDENGEACVDIKMGGVNQRGAETAPGWGTVILPSRDKKTWPVQKRLK